MPTTGLGYLAACHSLAQRFSAVTGGHARADIEVKPEGGVILRYSQGCSRSGNAGFAVVSEDELSILRALDSLTQHVARALAANVDGFELASIFLEDAVAKAGVAHVHFYCPAWHQSYSIPCIYQACDVNKGKGKQVTLTPVGPTQLMAEQSVGWDRLYDAGLIGPAYSVLPIVAQAIAQLLMVNDSFGLKARSVLLPGEHRQLREFAHNGIVLSHFEGGSGFWNVYPKGEALCVETTEGAKVLPKQKVQELNEALARWQAISDSVGDTVREAPR